MLAKEILKDTELKMKQALEAVKREFSEVRTGRAAPSLVEGLLVNYYGTPTPLRQIASINIPDARLIVIQPWDPTAIEEIEKAILKSNLGINPTNDRKMIRLAIPPLSDERRQELAKVVKNMAEDGKVSLRTIRRTSVETIRKLESEGKISEDDQYRTQEEIQKLTDKYSTNIDEILKNKEKDLMEF